MFQILQIPGLHTVCFSCYQCVRVSQLTTDTFSFLGWLFFFFSSTHYLTWILPHYLFPCLLPFKSNATLHDFANLRKNSEEWLESSNYIVNSAEILGQTLPMLQVWQLLSCVLHVWPQQLSSKSLVINMQCSGRSYLSNCESWCCFSFHPLYLSPAVSPPVRVPSATPL